MLHLVAFGSDPDLGATVRFAPTLLSLACSLLCTTAIAASAPYRVDPQQARSLPATEHTIDYGSFQWVWMEESAARAAGISGQLAQGKTVRIGDIERDLTASSSQPVLDAEGRGLQVVQFFGPAKQPWITALETQGAVALQYLPHNAVLLYGAPLSQAGSAPEVRAVAAFELDFKRDRSLSALAAGRSDRIIVMFHANGDQNSVLKQMQTLGATTLEARAAQPDQKLRYARVSADASIIERLLLIPQVINISFEPEAQIDDEAANQIMATPFTTPAALLSGYSAFLAGPLNGLTGAGVTWAVVDTGADREHPDLAPAWIGGVTAGCTLGSVPGDDAAGGGHGTHVAGAILGRGIGDGSGPAAETDAAGFLYGQGVAPATQLWAARIVCTGNTLSNAAVVTSALAVGASGSNNSWNNGAARSGYTASAREYDVLVRDADFATTNVTEAFNVFFSAGNAGSTGLTAPHEAKNIVSVANSGSTRSGTGPNLLNSTSSRGPADDGRILPVLTGVGTNTASTRNALGGSCATAIAGTADLYALCSGTSMSTPRASGAAALTVQWWRRNNLGSNPSPAMVKSVLVNGARDIPGSVPGDPNNIDGSRPIPNNDEGWGLINLVDTLASTVNGLYFDQQEVLSTVGSMRTKRVIAVDPNKPLKITLSWSDAPGAVSANPALVNNLDLAVTTAANSYLGNVFAAGTSVIGGVGDTLANLENVYIAAPGTAVHNITVTASALNGDALSGNGTPGNPRQDYALVCTNCRNAPTVTLSAPAATLDACAGSNFGPYPVTVHGTLNTGQTATMGLMNPPTALSNILFAPSAVTPTAVGAPSALSGTLAAGSTGPLALTVLATGADFAVQLPVSMNVYAAVPGSFTTTTPAAAATGVALTPQFSWTAAANVRSYRLEYTRDTSFTTLWNSVNQPAASFTPARALRSNAVYHWRVRAENACANGTVVSGGFFTTADPNGTIFSDGFGE